jgi:hypothetical protein
MPTVSDTGTEFDREEQLEHIQTVLARGEHLFFVYDCKGTETGCVGLTDQRLLFQDKITIPGLPLIMSVPFSKIAAVAVKGFGHILGTSKLVVVVDSRTYEFEFRSNEQADKAYKLIRARTLHGEGQPGDLESVELAAKGKRH